MANANPRGTFRRVADAVRVSALSAQGGDGVVHEVDVIREYGVSRTLARRALKVLETEGVLRPEPGVGWRVTGSPAPRSLSQLLVDLIHEKNLSPGDAFPSEATLCERFGKSRPVVRQALAKLEADGVLSSQPGKRRTVLRVPETPATPENEADETD